MFESWRRFVQFVSDSFQLFMIKRESKKLESFRPKQPTRFVIQPTIRNSQMGLNRSKLSGALSAINIGLTIEMVEVSSTSQTRVMDIIIAIRCSKCKTHQFCFFTVNTPTAASNAIQFHVE